MDIKEHDRVRCPSGLFGRVESMRGDTACVIYETTPPWQPGLSADLRNLRSSLVEKRTVVLKASLLRPA